GDVMENLQLVPLLVLVGHRKRHNLTCYPERPSHVQPKPNLQQVQIEQQKSGATFNHVILLENPLLGLGEDPERSGLPATDAAILRR
ncbi:MAG TPA: hypothetical protein VKV05_14185, partial [Terriglobales bacterium]|nr:hypothetical protein [Terriglobales bacterium]